MGESDAKSRGAERKKLELLYDLGCAFAARIKLDELFPLIVDKCCEVFDAEGASVMLLDEERQELFFPYAAETDPRVLERLRSMRFPADKGIAGSVLRSGKGARVDDVTAHARFFPNVDDETGFRTRNLICAPLRTHQGVIGVLQVLNARGGAFSDDDLAFLEALAGGTAVAIENARLYARVKESEELLRVQVGALRRDIAHRDRFDMVGSGPAMAEVFQLMQSAAGTPITVLIEGETGTGKELVARGIHAASARADAPFLAVNCAAVSETLLESELFGHKRGSFTGATQDHRGLFEAAQGGTVFLDEVGEMPPSMQAKLLRVLQEGEIIPVGEARPRKVDVRIISATNRNLEEEVRAGNFREDLFYRLAVFPIETPPLRERREDIPALCEHIIAKHRDQTGCTGIEEAALAALIRHDWPGNIRQLENEIERAAVIAGKGQRIEPRHLSARIRGGKPAAGVDAAAPTAGGADEEIAPLRAARAAFEIAYIRRALGKNEGNVSRTARVLGLSRVMLQKKMKEYGLRDAQPRSEE
jgi:transcriptional regulator with GAF, ATPase, and Fis domain